MELLVWILVVAAMVVGLAGVVLPVLPGQILIWGAAILHKIYFPDVLSWWTIALMGVAVLVGTVIEWASGVAGVKWFGGTKWGMAGAVIGGLVGLFFGLLPGLLIGPLIGAVIAEMIFARRTLKDSSKAGLGVAAGLAVSTVAKLALALLMIAAFFADALLF
ncbi:MAG: DUF456 domain-containing protein [Candidatus Methylacidiphilales bacterium]|nr:DUF456 domain-containing protein [Candidatus Methylacidiphilales bacterium]